MNLRHEGVAFRVAKIRSHGIRPVRPAIHQRLRSSVKRKRLPGVIGANAFFHGVVVKLQSKKCCSVSVAAMRVKTRNFLPVSKIESEFFGGLIAR